METTSVGSSPAKIGSTPTESGSTPTESGTTPAEIKTEMTGVTTRIYSVPPHLLGRNMDNPLEDMIGSGRRIQKPRLGVRVPCRNLTSQIVTQDEIAQEIYERSARRGTVHDRPEGGDLFFTKKLTHRLAKRITPANDQTELSPGILGDKLQLPTNTDKCRVPVVECKPADTAPFVVHALRYKLDPEKERELALKQLMELPTTKRRKRNIVQIIPKQEIESNGVSPNQQVNITPTANQKSIMAPTTPNSGMISVHNINNNITEIQQIQELTPPPPEETIEIAGAIIPVTRNFKSPRRTYGLRKGLQINESFEIETEIEKAKETTPKDSSEKIPKEKTKETPKEKAKETPKEKAKETPKEKAKDTPKDKAKETPKDKAKETPKVKAKETPKAKAKETPKVKAKETPKDKSKETPKDKAKETPKVKAKETPKAKAKETPKAKAKETPKVKAKETPKEKAKETPKGKTKETPKGKTKETPKGKTNETPKGKTNETPKGKTNETPKGKTNETPKGKTNETPKGKTKETPNDKIKESSAKDKKDQTSSRASREIANLLGDEGAIKLLYDVETGGSQKAKKRRFRTVDGKLKDLVLKTRLVKNAVMRLTSSPRRAPRRSAAPAVSVNYSDVKRRPSKDSPQPLLASLSPPASPPEFSFRLGASRIIRRHSSSSSFSSRSGSPTVTKRSAVNGANGTDSEKGSSRYDQLVGNGSKSESKSRKTKSSTDFEQPPAKVMKRARKPGVPIFIRKPTSPYKGGRVRRGDTPSSTGSLISEEDPPPKDSVSSLQAKHLTKKKMTFATKNKLKAQMSKNFQKGLNQADLATIEKGSKGRKASKDSDNNAEMPPPTISSSKADLPASTSSGTTSKKGFTIPSSPNATSYSNLVKSLEPSDSNKTKAERSSGRQTIYKELNVRKYEHLVQIILSPSSTKMKAAFNVPAMRELREALTQARKDDTCRAVLVTSSASTNAWCQGIDLPALLHTQTERRKAVAIEFAQSIKELARALASFPKPLIAGVHGPAMGLGVTILPLFDMVFASDKATFYTPYARLGQAPEGGAVLTLPSLYGNCLTMELLMASRRITANEALKHGLVTRVIWPDKFFEELIPSAKAIAANSAQSLEATKALVRHGIRAKLDAALDSEGSLLVQHWTTTECQSAIRKFLEDEEELGLQKQRVDIT